ncbi:MAG: type I-D CRISPR-associated protein Cas5/Csc1 [Candidatus Syntropharchaeia archaeon]
MNCIHANIQLCEDVYFASLEIGRYYQTYPVVGNYALAYALKFVESTYDNNKGKPSYSTDFSSLNEMKVYITPAQPVKKVRYSFYTFNALSDGYYFKMDKAEYNYPRMGRIKALSQENVFDFYIIATDRNIFLPKYIRLGKWMSKVKVAYSESDYTLREKIEYRVNHILNPSDLPLDTEILRANYISMYPTPLMKTGVLRGKALEVKREDGKHVYLPYGMSFGRVLKDEISAEESVT